MKRLQKFRGFFREIFRRNARHFPQNPFLRRRFQIIFGFLDIVVGIFFVMLGFLGIILPVIPGLLFFVLGVLFISPHHGRKMLGKMLYLWKKIRLFCSQRWKKWKKK